MLDGAHNPVKLAALIDRLRAEPTTASQARLAVGVRLSPGQEGTGHVGHVGRGGGPGSRPGAGPVPRSRPATSPPTCRPTRASWPPWPGPPGSSACAVATLDEAADRVRAGAVGAVTVVAGSFHLLAALRPRLLVASDARPRGRAPRLGLTFGRQVRDRTSHRGPDPGPAETWSRDANRYLHGLRRGLRRRGRRRIRLRRWSRPLHVEAGLIDAYDAAVIEHREGGKVKITKKHETPTRVGGVMGGGVGLATGLVVALFPFAAIGGGLLAATTGGGALLGAVAGHAAAGMSRSDLKELGEQLDEGQAGLVVVAVSDMGAKVEKAMKKAEKVQAKEIKADNAEIEKDAKAAEKS